MADDDNDKYDPHDVEDEDEGDEDNLSYHSNDYDSDDDDDPSHNTQKEWTHQMTQMVTSDEDLMAADFISVDNIGVGESIKNAGVGESAEHAGNPGDPDTR